MIKNKIIARGVGLGLGRVAGKIRIVKDKKTAQRVETGDIVYVAKMRGEYGDFARRAAGFVVKANPADHLATYIRETWKPAVLIVKEMKIKNGAVVTVDSVAGAVFTGISESRPSAITPLGQAFKTKIYLQFSLPWLASEAAQLNCAGVGLLRTNIILQEKGLHPSRYKNGKAMEDVLYNGIAPIAQAFFPKPIWVRTMDFSTLDLKSFMGGQNEPQEDNPMLGWRGIARELSEPNWLKSECRVLRRLIKDGLTNIGVFFPMVRDVSEYKRAKSFLSGCGLKPHKDIKVGSMFEVPSAVLTINEFIDDGLDLAFIGINDLTQYTLASDRTNKHLARIYNPAHPAVAALCGRVLDACKKYNIETTATWQLPMLKILGDLIDSGLTSITVHPDMIKNISNALQKYEGLLHSRR